MACFFRPFADRRRLPRAARGVSLIEVMVSQVIALFVIAGIMSLVVAMIRKLNSELSVADAQIHLRQASHLLLRDTQGVGGEITNSGDAVFVVEGGTNAADTVTIFKRDESVCGGRLPVDNSDVTPPTLSSHDGNTINFTDTTAQPCIIGTTQCTRSELTDRTFLIVGPSRSLQMTGHNANGSSCKINFPTGQQASDVVAAYNARYPSSPPSSAPNNINQVLDQLQPDSVLVGTSFTYRLSGSSLQRSTSGGAFEDILAGVLDLQVERVYFDDDVDANAGLLYLRATSGQNCSGCSAPLPASFEDDEFIGLRIGLITFSPARADLAVGPPDSLSTTTGGLGPVRSLASAPGDRRYRASFIFAASRNRRGA